MAPTQDGRTYSCNYCGARRLIAVDAGQIAQGFAIDLSNLSAFLHRLAHALETAVADRTRVMRDGQEVVSLELSLGSRGWEEHVFDHTAGLGRNTRSAVLIRAPSNQHARHGGETRSVPDRWRSARPSGDSRVADVPRRSERGSDV